MLHKDLQQAKLWKSLNILSLNFEKNKKGKTFKIKLNINIINFYFHTKKIQKLKIYFII